MSDEPKEVENDSRVISKPIFALWIYRLFLVVFVAVLYFWIDIARNIINIWGIFLIPGIVAAFFTKIDPANRYIYAKAIIFYSAVIWIWNGFRQRGKDQA